MAARSRITSLESVPEDSTFVFRVSPTGADGSGSDGGCASDGSGEREAILVRYDDGVACWLNSCRHLTHVPLDKGSGAVVRDGEIVCENHGAYFEADTGRCTFGPCEGAVLTGLSVAVEDGDVYLADDDYAYHGPGPIADDEVDRSSSSNVGL